MLKQTQVVRGVGCLSTESNQMIIQLMKNHHTTSIMQQLTKLTTGGRFPPNSMAKLRAWVFIQKFNCDRSETTAETLLRLLEDDDDVLFVRFAYSYDEASNLV